MNRQCIREEVIAHTVSGETQSEWVYHYSDNTTESVKGAWTNLTNKDDIMETKGWRDREIRTEAANKDIQKRNEEIQTREDREKVRKRRAIEARKDLIALGVLQ